MIGMNGLRMFIPPDNGPVKGTVFYSQRSCGPIYRWHYEEDLARWHVARLAPSRWSAHELCAAPWQSVPEKLKAQLSEHYVD